MSTQAEQIEKLINSNTELKAYFESKRASIDSAVDAARKSYAELIAMSTADYNALYKNAFNDLAAGIPIGYHEYNQLFDLADLIEDNAIDKDGDNPTYTKWKALEGAVLNRPLSATSRTIMQFSGLASIPLGHYENPQYSFQKSRGRVEFVVSNNNATNEQINKSLIDNAVTPTRGGEWARIGLSQRIQVPSSLIAGATTAFPKIFFRFLSEVTDRPENEGFEDQEAQEIDEVDGVYFYLLSAEYF